ncbi:unnamed protein product [Cuscuta epithymum]|uniref:Uncharacterized protein n=2 Tax=Cuscuta epithymum TaxID=186058 RepID=A0AAV0EGE2_9ASTE|nr:unnamed protein product [Cuscuta epithymum]
MMAFLGKGMDKGCSGKREESERGKGILVYQRKSRNNMENPSFFSSATKLIMDQQERVEAAPPTSSATVWADANSSHLLTCACHFCLTEASNSTHPSRSNILDLTACPRPEPAGTGNTPNVSAAATVSSWAKVHPSILMPPPSWSSPRQNQLPPLPHRNEISLPPLGDISFREFLNFGRKRRVSCCRDMLHRGGFSDEELKRWLKEELFIRDVDAYASIIRSPNMDFEKLLPGSSSDNEHCP